MSLGGVPCAPPPPMTLLSSGLAAQIRKGYFCWVTPTPWGSSVDFAPSILLWGANRLSVIFIPGPLPCSIILASSWGAFILLLSFSSSSWGVFNPLLSFSSSSWWVFLLLLFRWDYEGHGRIVTSATCFGGLCFYGHSSICHSGGQGCFITGGDSPDKCQGTATDG